MSEIALDFIPTTEAELIECLGDPMWRICSGVLYKIMLKSDDGEGTVAPFRPNRAQRQLIARLWHRNIILKARQLGFTTLIAILWLDHALFNSDQRCGIIAQDREAAEVIFRDKVKLAYNNLPELLRERFPLARDSASEILFGHNNSSVRVATSMRSGTIHRLHISEFGKICAKFPDKAAEVVTGSLPAVPLDGIAVIESTAEGREGEFFTMTQRAIAQQQKGTALTPRDWRFHFFPWWDEPNYTLDDGPDISDRDAEYFAKIEVNAGRKLTEGQKRWYVTTRDSDFGGDEQRMWQEYPSAPDEAFQVSTEGTYYAAQLAAAYRDRRVGMYPHVDGVKVNTFWDIGAGDGTGIWLHQRVGGQNRFIRYIEGWGEPYSHYLAKLQACGYLWGKHHLPHDAAHKRQQGAVIEAPIDILRRGGIAGDWSIVPQISDVMTGIQMVRSVFSQCVFDEVGCKEGIEHLAGYRKTWNERAGCWSDTPRHDIHSEGADAFRQFAQGYQGEADEWGGTLNYPRVTIS